MDIKKVPSDELARICAEKPDVAVWAEFVRRFSRPIAKSALRVGRAWGNTSPAIIDDIVQDVFVKLCENDRRILREFEPHHEDSFLAFVSVVAAATASDVFRRCHTTKRGGGVKEEPIRDHHGSDSNGSLVQDGEWLERHHLLKEIDGFLKSYGGNAVGRRDRTVFWLYYQQGMTANAIASIPGMSLSVKGVESSLHRTIGLIRSHLRKPAVSTPLVKKIVSRKGIYADTTIQRSEWL